MSVLTLPPSRQRSDQVPAAIATGSAWLRPLGPGEQASLLAVFAAMSPASRYARYLQGVAELTPSMVRALSDVDGERHVAWLASVDGRAAGIGRYLKVDACTAEIAFEVADDVQGRGLGGVLLDTVTTVAAAAGIHRLQATVLGSNHHSRHLLSQVGLELRSHGAGVLEADGPFHLPERPRVNRSHVLRIAFGSPPLAA